MKKLVLFIIFLAFINTPIQGVTTNSTLLDKIENSIFGYTYSDEADDKRISRIEENVYGQTSQGQIQNRIAKLKKDLLADLIGQQIEPKVDTFEDEEFELDQEELAESEHVDYPVINEMEKNIFNQEYKNDKIKDRLTRLENKCFKKAYADEDLSTRVDRLKAHIKPKEFIANNMETQDNQFYDGNVGQFPRSYHLQPYGGSSFDYNSLNRGNPMNSNFPQYSDFDDFQATPNVFQKSSRPLNITAIEKYLYKTKYENEPMEKRLSRIESSVFGTEFDNDTNEERLERLSSAIQAQKSARRYDSNRFSQNVTTAVQIGTLILMVLACIL